MQNPNQVAEIKHRVRIPHLYVTKCSAIETILLVNNQPLLFVKKKFSKTCYSLNYTVYQVNLMKNKFWYFSPLIRWQHLLTSPFRFYNQIYIIGQSSISYQARSFVFFFSKWKVQTKSREIFIVLHRFKPLIYSWYILHIINIILSIAWLRYSS